MGNGCQCVFCGMSQLFMMAMLKERRSFTTSIHNFKRQFSVISAQSYCFNFPDCEAASIDSILIWGCWPVYHKKSYHNRWLLFIHNCSCRYHWHFAAKPNPKGRLWHYGIDTHMPPLATAPGLVDFYRWWPYRCRVELQWGFGFFLMG